MTALAESPPAANLWRGSEMVLSRITFLFCLGIGLLSVAAPNTWLAAEELPSRLSVQVDALKRSGLADSVLADSVVTLFREAGYFDARVMPGSDSFTVQSGSRFDLDYVYVTGDTIMTVPVGEPFEQSVVELALNRIVARYREQGYYFSSLRIERVTRSTDRLSLTANLIRGPVSRIGRVHYEGLSRTRSDLIDRYLTVASGDTVTESLLRDIRNEAASISFVMFQPPLTIMPAPGYGAVDVIVPFRERQQFRFEGGAGYGSGDDGGAVWSFTLGLNNLFGGGRDVAVQSQRPDQGRRELKVRYRQPLMLLGRGALQVEVATRDYRDQFNDFSLTSAYETRLQSGLSAQVALGWKTVTQKEPAPSYGKYSVSFGIGQRHLDDVVNPSRGYEFSSSAGFVYRRYASSGEDGWGALNETRLRASGALYFPLGKPLGMRLALGYDGLNSPEELPPVSELTFVGGPPMLRGFRSQQFAVLRAAYGTLEPYWRFAGGKLFAFCDGAYLYNRRLDLDNRVVGVEGIEYGYGFGLSLAAAGGGMRLSLGWNHELAFDEPRLSVEFTSDL